MVRPVGSMQLMFTRQVGDSGGGNMIAQSSRVSIMLWLRRVYLFAHSPSNESTCERDLLPLCSFGSERVYVFGYIRTARRRRKALWQ